MIPNVNFSTFIDHIKTQVFDDPDFQSHVQSIFSRDLNLMIGYVSVNPPKISECPLCILSPVSTPITQAVEEYSWSFDLNFAVDAHDITVSIDQLDALVKRFANDLEESLCDKNAILSVSNFTFIYDKHPLLISNGDIRFSIQNVLGNQAINF